MLAMSKSWRLATLSYTGSGRGLRDTPINDGYECESGFGVFIAECWGDGWVISGRRGQ